MGKKRAKVIGEPPVPKELEELIRLSARHSRLKHELLEKLEEFKAVDKQLAELEEKFRRGI